MKNLARIIIWTAIALIIQHGVFFYIENIYLSDTINLQVEKVEEKHTVKKSNPEIKIKDGVKDVTVSSDGEYAAYFENNNLKTLNIADNTENEFKSDDDGEVVFYKWLTNEDRIIVIKKIEEDGIYYFKPLAFDAKKGETTELTDFSIKKLKIKLVTLEDKVDEIAFSDPTGTLYIKVKKSNGKCDLYYSNIMNQLERVRKNKNIGKIVVPTTNANAVMELDSKITILNNPDNLEIPNVENAKILGTDIDDYVYFGEEVNGKIKRIYYTILSDKNRVWSQLNFKNPVNREEIIVDYSGKVYINNKLENSVLELKSNKYIKYEGELLQSYSKGIISKSGNKLIKNNIE